MVRLNEVRRNEVAVEPPASFDAGLTFIGSIRTPWTSRLDCPRQGRADGPVCRIEVYEPWVAALDGIDLFERLEVLYWLHEFRRDLVRQSPANDGATRGTFSLRSPVRPNPIGTALVTLVARDGATLSVRGLDCLDRTPLIDLKPDRCLFTPLAPPQKGDFETGRASSQLWLRREACIVASQAVLGPNRLDLLFGHEFVALGLRERGLE